MEKHLLIAVCFLFSLIYGQTYLSSGSQYSGYANGYGYGCYAIYANSGDTVTVEVTATTSGSYLRLSTYSTVAVCNSTAYATYAVASPVDGNRYTLTFKSSTYGYIYFGVYNSYYYGASFTIKATTSSYAAGNFITNNSTYYGYAPGYGTGSYINLYFYVASDSFEIDVSGYYSYFYIKKSNYASSSSYDLNYYTYSSTVTQNKIGGCSSSSTSLGAGYYYVAIQSYYAGSYPFSFKVIPTPPSSSSITTLSTGTTYVTLNPGYNYFQVYGYSSYGILVNLTQITSSTYIATGPSSSSGCIPSTWSYSTSLSSTTPAWLFYPGSNGYQVLAIYSYQSTAVSTPVYLQIIYSSDYSDVSSTAGITVTNPGYNWVYFEVTDGLPAILSLSSYMQVYVKQGQYPTSSNYDAVFSDGYSTTLTIDPCTWGGSQGIFYIGITNTYLTTTTLSVSSYVSTSCYDPPLPSASNQIQIYHSDVGIVVGSIVGTLVICSIVVFGVVHACKRRRQVKSTYAPVPKSVQLETYSEHSAPSYVPMYAPGPMPYMAMPTANGNAYMMPAPMYGNPYAPSSGNPYMPPPYAVPLMSTPVVVPPPVQQPVTTPATEENKQ